MMPRLAPAALLPLLVLAGSALAYPSAYVLQEESVFEEGCVDGCLCPITMTDLAGAFLLRPAGRDGDFDVFQVSEARWTVFGNRPVTGSGTLRIDAAGGLQRLELTLAVGTDPPEAFDSGLVPLEAQLPDIRAAVAMNGFYCFDRVFTIRAEPAEPVAREPTRWGRIKALGFAPIEEPR